MPPRPAHNLVQTYLFDLSPKFPPVQLVLTLLAGAACGLERIWALNDVSDRGLALFTGRWTPLRASQVYTWLKQMRAGAVDLFYPGTKIEE